jgi:hypothetical protein
VLVLVPIAAVLAVAAVVSGAIGGGDDDGSESSQPIVIASPTAAIAIAPSPTQPPLPTATPAPSATNRRDCAAIRGTDYRSEEERLWFTQNCLATATSAAATPTVVRTPTAGAAAPSTPGVAATATPAAGAQNPAAFLGSANPPANFCSFAACVPNFFQDPGFVVQCGDGLYSKTGGTTSVCPGRGGVLRSAP